MADDAPFEVVSTGESAAPAAAPSAAPPAAPSTEPTVATHPAHASPSDIGSEQGNDEGPVPYSRFHESRTQLQGERTRSEQLEARNRTLEQQLQTAANYFQQVQPHLQKLQDQPAAAPPAATEEWVDPIEQRLSEKLSSHEDLINRQQAQLKAQEKRWHDFQVASERTRIESEIQAARAEYPYLVPEQVLDGILANPRANVRALAKSSHDWFSKRAMDYHAAQQRPAAPPSRSLMPSGQTGLVEHREVNSLDEAREATVELFDRLVNR